MENINEMGLVELDNQTVQETDGGFIALTILGVTYAASTVATAMGAACVAGIAAGVTAAVATD